MKAHLKTIGVFLAVTAVAVLGTMFPNVFVTMLMAIGGAMGYWVIYSFFKNKEDKDELSGPFNAGGRERD